MKLEKEQNSQWNNATYENIIVTLKNQKKYNIQKNDYKNEGLYPIMSQEQKFISGFTNDCSKVFNIKDDSYILFGDHTTIFKYLDFDFTIGADGTKIFKSFDDNILRTRFLYYISINKLIESTGYNRHFKMLKEKVISYPEDINEQDKIVSILDQQQGLIDSYKEKLSLLEEQETYYQDELLSGRLRIRLTDESINYTTQQGWYLNDDLVEGKEKEFEEWIAVDFHSKVEFYKEENFTKFLNNSFSNFISNNFNIVKIGDLGEIRTGNTPSKKDSSNYGDSYNWYTTPDFRTGRAFDSKLKLSDLGFSKARIANVNDILVTCIGELGQTAIVEKIGGFNQQINCITLNGNYDVNYIFTLIKRHKKYIQSFSKKNVVDIINKTDFSNIEIYVPKSNKEQKMMASFFNIFNNQFQLLNEKIKVEEEKMDYLMDELLSGRIRVK